MLKRCGPGEPKSSRMGLRFDYNLNLSRGEEYIPIKGVWTSECIPKDWIPLLWLVLAGLIPNPQYKLQKAPQDTTPAASSKHLTPNLSGATPSAGSTSSKPYPWL
jgi:hypothetical protein